MKKILVIGSKGMAGHVIKRYLESLDIYEVWGIARNIKSKNKSLNLDVFDTKKLEKIIDKGGFKLIINCVGLLNETAENNPNLAIWFNSYFPHHLSTLGKKYNFKIIHISTDCVFSGIEGGYKEDSFKNGIGYYAQSKALGEIINRKDLTFRTSIIGPELKKDGIGLFHWFMSQKNQIHGYSNAYWTGVTTIELVKGIHEAIKQDLTGLYHFVNNTKISKLNLLNELNYNFRDGNFKIIPNSDYTIDKSLINTRKDFNYVVPSYKFMIKEMKNWILDNDDLYDYYNIKSS